MTTEKVNALLKTARKEFKSLVRLNNHERYAARQAMNHADEQSNETHGVESLSRTNGNGFIMYLNTGDSYGHTVLCSVTGNSIRFYAGNWGDLAERNVVR